MALQPRIIACGNSTAAFAMAVRFLTGPAVMAAASIVVGLRDVLLHVAIVQVPLPLPLFFFFLNECFSHTEEYANSPMLLSIPSLIITNLAGHCVAQSNVCPMAMFIILPVASMTDNITPPDGSFNSVWVTSSGLSSICKLYLNHEVLLCKKPLSPMPTN